VDYGRPVQFGVFTTPDATQPDRALKLAEIADELGFDRIGAR
jgi:alkanesulfonate monooxygenase SsuD/methylene tetrahydromethanopterin reductase-like flavin-dependent oxidoreductase (luciferase family)